MRKEGEQNLNTQERFKSVFFIKVRKKSEKKKKKKALMITFVFDN